MSGDELLRLTHAYREDALSDVDAVRLGEALTTDAQARQALALDGQIAEALADERAADDALLATLRAHWPVRSPSSARHVRPRTGTLRRRAIASRWLTVAGLATMVVLTAVWWSRPGTPATGTVLVAAPLTIGDDHPTIRRTGTAEALTGTQGLRSGDRMSLPAGATVALSGRSEATVLHLTGPAELTLTSDAPGKRLVLHRGHLSATVAPQPAGHPLEISCPFSEVTVVGTTFSIAAEDAGDRIDVRHGTVRVAAPDGRSSVLVAEGHVAEVGPGRPLALRTAAPTATTITAVSTPKPDVWFDFATATGHSVADRLAGKPGTLIDATIGSDGRGGSALRLDGGNSRFVFPVPDARELTIALTLRRERQPASDPNPTLITLPNLVLYTNLGQDPPARTDHSLHLITRSGPPISGWSTNGQLLRHGEWQWLVVTVRTAADGAVVPEVWVDGVHQHLWPWKGDWPQVRPDPHHGTLGIEPGVQYSIAGLVKDLRLWPRVLSAAEITALVTDR